MFASGFDALLFSQEKGQLFFISSRRAVAELLNYNTGACVKRDSSPAHKASLKWLGIPEITHSNPSRAASSLQHFKQSKLQRARFRHGVSLTKMRARRKAGGCQPLQTEPCQTSRIPRPRALQLGAKSVPFLLGNSNGDGETIKRREGWGGK